MCRLQPGHAIRSSILCRSASSSSERSYTSASVSLGRRIKYKIKPGRGKKGRKMRTSSVPKIWAKTSRVRARRSRNVQITTAIQMAVTVAPSRAANMMTNG